MTVDAGTAGRGPVRRLDSALGPAFIEKGRESLCTRSFIAASRRSHRDVPHREVDEGPSQWSRRCRRRALANYQRTATPAPASANVAGLGWQLGSHSVLPETDRSEIEMAKSSSGVPPVRRLLWPSLEAVREHGDSVTIEEHDEAVGEKLRLNDEQLALLHGDGPETEFRYRMKWARTYLKGIGTLENSSRGVWVLTDLGRRVGRDDVASLERAWRKQMREARAAREAESSDDGGAAGAEVEGSWTDDLLRRLAEVSPEGFERLSQRLLREEGFANVEVLGRSGDGGLDGVGHYRMSLVSFPIYFQCKRYKGTVGPNHVRDFRGAMAGRGEKGLLITTGTFTRDAQREASRDGAPAIELIDGQRLAELLKKHELGVKVRTEVVEHVEVAAEFFNQF